MYDDTCQSHTRRRISGTKAHSIPFCVVSSVRSLQTSGLRLGYVLRNMRVFDGSFGVAAVTLDRLDVLDVLAYYFRWPTKGV